LNKQSLRIGFLASGNGSSARAIVDAIRRGEISAEAGLLVSNRKDCAALAWAREMGLPARCIPTTADPDGADARLAEAMQADGVQLIVMSGYLRRLGPHTLGAYADRILNIHPGPLPAFGGEGMYGRRVHEAVCAAGLAETAMTIHLVDEEYDHGAVVASRAVPLAPGETPDSLEARVRALEPGFFTELIGRFARGETRLGAGLSDRRFT